MAGDWIRAGDTKAVNEAMTVRQRPLRWAVEAGHAGYVQVLGVQRGRR